MTDIYIGPSGQYWIVAERSDTHLTLFPEYGGYRERLVIPHAELDNWSVKPAYLFGLTSEAAKVRLLAGDSLQGEFDFEIFCEPSHCWQWDILTNKWETINAAD